MPLVDLRQIYLATLNQCAPDALVRGHVSPSMPHDVVAIGKCAGALLDGVAAVHQIRDAFVAIPAGYPPPQTNAEVHVGGHPHMTPASFAAGRALLEFVDAHPDVLFLISGGGSACVEAPLPPHTEDEVAGLNETLIASGQPIGAINAERSRVSAIKGGRLRERVRGRAVTLVYSDVSTGALADVASGPTLTSSDQATCIADNSTLVRAAARIAGESAIVMHRQLESDVEKSASILAAFARSLGPGQLLVAGGEPTTVVRGHGRGGRCSELAVRFARLSTHEALFGSSDGVDGNSGAAGIHLPARAELLAGIDEDLERSDSYPIAAQVGEPIMIAPTGNNLRDLFLVAGELRARD